MAITKAKLIADGVITVDNLHTSHGITTDHIGEGSKLFYTDARVSSYLTSNNYTTSAGGYFYDATLSANILTFSKSDGTTETVDLSLYLDDTNLARLVSGTLDGQTGVATFTRDDSSTFTIDFSAFLADANDYVSSGSFNTTTGVLTLTRLGGGTVTVDLDGKYAEASHTHLWAHITDRPTALSAFTNDLGNYGGFLTSFTETDPVYVASSWYTTTNNSSNWNTAYGWGNHANTYSLLGHTHDDIYYTELEIDDYFSGSKSITGYNKSNWDTAYSWGNHASAGYITGYTETDTLASVTGRGASSSSNITLTGQLDLNKSGTQLKISRADSGSANWFFHSWSSGLNIYPDAAGTVYFGRDGSTTNVDVYNGTLYQQGNAVIHAGNIGSQSVSYANSAGSATDSSKLPLTGGTLSGTLVLGSVASAGSSAILNTNGFIRVSEHVLIHNPADLSMAQGISWDSSTNGLYTYTESATGTLRATGSMRAPLFYDSDNTGYYVDPSSISVMATVSAGILNGTDVYTTGGWFRNHTNSNGIYWSATGWHLFPHNDSDFRIHSGNGTNVSLRMETNGTTRGYVYAENDNTIGFLSNSRGWTFRTYSDGNALVYGYITANSSMRAPIFYDSGNTAHYIDPSGGSNIRNLYVGDAGSSWSDPGGWGTQFHVSNGPHSIIRVYARNEGIETGMYSHVGGQSKVGSLTNHDFSLIRDYTVGLTLYSGYVQAEGSSRAPVFYDSNNTGYYVDPASTSNLNVVQVQSIRNDGSVSTDDGFGVYWDSNGSTAYAIYREGGGWTHPYPDLRIAFHTGIKLGANSSYNGIRFYTDYDMGTQVMSVNNGSDPLGGGHVYVNNTLQAGEGLRAPIFYDSNDTAYYIDPNSTSRVSCIKSCDQYREASISLCGYKYTTPYGTENSFDYSIHLTDSSSCIYASFTCNGVGGSSNYDSWSFYPWEIQVSPFNGEKFVYDSYDGALYIGGTLYQNYYSDCRYKTNIVPIESALDKIDAIRGVEFDWNELGLEEAYKEGHEVGVIAQEVQSVYPIAVREVSKERQEKVVTALVVDYEKLIPLLVQGIKELRQEVNDIKQQINGGSI